MILSKETQYRRQRILRLQAPVGLKMIAFEGGANSTQPNTNSFTRPNTIRQKKELLNLACCMCIQGCNYKHKGNLIIHVNVLDCTLLSMRSSKTPLPHLATWQDGEPRGTCSTTAPRCFTSMIGGTMVCWPTCTAHFLKTSQME